MPELLAVHESGLSAMARAREILDKAYEESREMSAEENTNYTAALADADRHKDYVDQEMAMRERDSRFASLVIPGAAPERVEDARARATGNPSIADPSGDPESDPILKFIQGRERGNLPGNGMMLRHRDMWYGDMEERIREGLVYKDGSAVRQRDLSVGTAGKGGNLVETSLMRSLSKSP